MQTYYKYTEYKIVEEAHIIRGHCATLVYFQW